MAFLEIRNIVKTFAGRTVLNQIQLEIAKGSFTSFLGHSGCGKTTLLRIIAGIEKPESGQIILDGKDITEIPAQQRNLGLVFQNYALFPHMNVFENIAFGLRLKKLKQKQIQEKVENILDKINLLPKIDQYVSSLSGGEQQRVALARAIVLEPSVLLLDEPLSNLDFSMRLQARTELKRLQQELGITTIFVTHDQAEALALSDTIVVMNGGLIMQKGSPSDVYQSPANTFTAAFVGRYNLCTPTEAKNIFKTAIEDHQLLAILPENLRIVKSDASIKCKIKDISYCGSMTEVFLSHEDKEMKSLIPSTDLAGLKIDDKVTPQIFENKFKILDNK